MVQQFIIFHSSSKLDSVQLTKLVSQRWFGKRPYFLRHFFAPFPFPSWNTPSICLRSRESGNLTRSNSARASKKDLIVHCARQFNQVNNGSHFKDFAKYSFCFAYYGPQEEWGIDNFVWTMKRQMLVFIAIMYDQGDAALYIVGLWSSSSGCIIGRDTVWCT